MCSKSILRTFLKLSKVLLGGLGFQVDFFFICLAILVHILILNIGCVACILTHEVFMLCEIWRSGVLSFEQNNCMSLRS